METLNILKSLIEPYKVITIIGTSKNAGKTTVLNQIIKENNSPLGIVSVGYEGESIDLVTAISKPRIFIKKETIVATAQKLIQESDVTFSILQKTSITSPLGPIIIAKAASNGFVKIAGPSIVQDLETIIEFINSYTVSKIIIDGALYKTSLAKSKYSEAIILATSANLSPDIDEVVYQTTNFYNRLMSNKTSCFNSEFINRSQLKKYTLFNSNNTYQSKQSVNTLENSNNIYSKFYVNGALTLEVVDKIITLEIKEVIINHSSSLSIDDQLIRKMKDLNIIISVLLENNVILLTVNPTSILNYRFKTKDFIQKLKHHIEVPICDVSEVSKC